LWVARYVGRYWQVFITIVTSDGFGTHPWTSAECFEKVWSDPGDARVTACCTVLESSLHLSNSIQVCSAPSKARKCLWIWLKPCNRPSGWTRESTHAGTSYPCPQVETMEAKGSSFSKEGISGQERLLHNTAIARTEGRDRGYIWVNRHLMPLPT